MFYTVYKITNWCNGKIYIGIHKTNDLNDNYMGSGKRLKYAQEKYGIQYFTKEYLAIFDNPDDMYEMESCLVNEEFIKRDDTYNIKEGGCGGFDFINEHKLNLYGQNGQSGFGLENLIAFKQHHLHKMDNDVEYRQSYCEKISKGLKTRYKHYPKIGVPHTEKTKQHLSRIKKGTGVGENNSQYGKVRCVPIDALNCKHHVGYFPDQIPPGWVTTKEWKERRKEVKLKQSITKDVKWKERRKEVKLKQSTTKDIKVTDKFEEKSNNAYCWYDCFLSSNSKSLGEFVRESTYPYSLVSLTKMFKKYVEEFDPTPGKPFNFIIP